MYINQKSRKNNKIIPKKYIVWDGEYVFCVCAEMTCITLNGFFLTSHPKNAFGLNGCQSQNLVFGETDLHRTGKIFPIFF